MNLPRMNMSVFKKDPSWRIRVERFFDLLSGMRLRHLSNCPRLSSRRLHQASLKAVGAREDGDGGIIFDVGAHVGETAIALALEFPRASIHAFEPVSAIFNHLKKNCRRYPNVMCHNVALGAQAETRSIILHSPEISCTMNQMSRLATESTPAMLRETVRIMRLDDVCREHGIHRIAFLKVDVEGFELEVLRGASAMLKSGQIQSVIAEVTFTPASRCHVHFDDVRRTLELHGFVFVGYYDSTYQPESGRLSFTNALFCLEPVAG